MCIKCYHTIKCLCRQSLGQKCDKEAASSIYSSAKGSRNFFTNCSFLWQQAACTPWFSLPRVYALYKLTIPAPNVISRASGLQYFLQTQPLVFSPFQVLYPFSFIVLVILLMFALYWKKAMIWVNKYHTLLSLICHIKFKVANPNQKLDLLTVLILSEGLKAGNNFSHRPDTQIHGRTHTADSFI